MPSACRSAPSTSISSTGRTEPALTQEMVDSAVEAAQGNVTAAAAMLGISRGKILRYRKREKG